MTDSQAISSRTVFLPLLGNASAPSGGEIPGESYGSLSINGPPADRQADQHADLNLALRGYTPTLAFQGLVDIDGPADHRAPQLRGLFSDQTLRPFRGVYQVYHWNWEKNQRDTPITTPPVTLLGLATIAGETVHVPAAGYEIGSGYQVLVLFADEERITMKYTREDNVVYGYTLHVEGIQVEPSLLALYRALDAAGRAHLPALRAGQAFGLARGQEVKIAIRDCGSFMDPRSRKDWWQGM